MDKSKGLNAAEERDRSARAYAELDFRMLPGGVHDMKDVVDDFFIDVDFAAVVLKRDDISRRADTGSTVALLLPLVNHFRISFSADSLG